MTLVLEPTNPALSWQGAVSLETTADWTQPWRIPHTERGLFHEALVDRAGCASGVRVAFLTDAARIAGKLDVGEITGKVDLCCDGELVGSKVVQGDCEFAFDGLPEGRKLTELWLPQAAHCRVKSIELPDGAYVGGWDDERPRWITYGSSITHCGGAESPTQTWPGVAARTHDLNLTSLGFGGNCHLDPLMATTIRDLPADYLSMCVGINVYGGASLSPRTFRPGVIAFVRLVREKHPETPFVVMSPIYSPPRESTPNAVGFTLEWMRSEVEGAVRALQDAGDANVHYVDGLEVFGEDCGEYLPDNLHPNAEGYKVLGRSFAEKVISRFFV